jgi:hypothetical protein
MKVVAFVFVGILLVSTHQSHAETPPDPDYLSQEAPELSAVMHELTMIMPLSSPTGSLRGPTHVATDTDAAGSNKRMLTATSAERQELLLEEADELTTTLGRLEPFLSADSALMSAVSVSQRPMFASLQTQLVLAQEASNHMISLFEGFTRVKSESPSKDTAQVEALRRYLSETDEQEPPEPEEFFRSSSNRHKNDHSSSWSQHSSFGGAGTHDAFNGDWSFATKYFQASHHGRKIVNRAPVHPHGRDLRAGSSQEKEDQCKLLIECVEAMNLYDLVIFFYQDNIDFETGAFDKPGSFTEYDEGETGIMGKQALINTALEKAKTFVAGAAPTDYKEDDKCDLLLEEFHVTLESDFGPRWYEGNVTNVCLAQGTTQYTRISEIETAIDTAAAKRISEDVNSCARELHKKRPMDGPFAEDKYVFASDSGAVRLPSGIKIEGDRDRHGQLDSTDPADFYDFLAVNGKSSSRDSSCALARSVAHSLILLCSVCLSLSLSICRLKPLLPDLIITLTERFFQMKSRAHFHSS